MTYTKITKTGGAPTRKKAAHADASSTPNHRQSDFSYRASIRGNGLV